MKQECAFKSFLPLGMQFSFVPWIYDQEVIDHCLEMIALREQYSEEMVELFKQATITGEPINKPIWMLDPDDEAAFEIDDGRIHIEIMYGILKNSIELLPEFMFGNNVLVAPVLEKSATSRMIYFPKGLWFDPRRNTNFTGPVWVDYEADLFTLPYFTKQ